jgi:hypothetical protein
MLKIFAPSLRLAIFNFVKHPLTIRFTVFLTDRLPSLIDSDSYKRGVATVVAPVAKPPTAVVSQIRSVIRPSVVLYRTHSPKKLIGTTKYPFLVYLGLRHEKPAQIIAKLTHPYYKAVVSSRTAGPA